MGLCGAPSIFPYLMDTAFSSDIRLSDGTVVSARKIIAIHLDDLVVIYMHAMHAWLTVQMLWQMHGRTLQAVHMHDCLHGNIRRCSKEIVYRYVGIAQDCAHRIIDCAQRSTSVRI